MRRPPQAITVHRVSLLFSGAVTIDAEACRSTPVIKHAALVVSGPSGIRDLSLRIALLDWFVFARHFGSFCVIKTRYVDSRRVRHGWFRSTRPETTIIDFATLTQVQTMSSVSYLTCD